MGIPLVSVIVPVYNAANYICECVDSILSQTYNNIEVILINDGSSDESDAVIKKHYSSDKRVVYISKNNEGVSKTRNCGIEKASGDYFTFVDADDWLEKSFIDEAVRSAKQYDLDIVLGGTKKIFINRYEECVANSSQKVLIYQNNMSEYIKKVLSNGIIKDSPLNSCFTSGPVCKLFKKDVIATVKFDEKLFIGEDTVFNLQILEQTKRIGVVPRLWYNYRMNNDSVTKGYNPNIKLYTEKLLSTLMSMYYDNEQLKPYLIVRAVQQFYGMLLLYPLNRSSKLNIWEKRIFIKQCFDSKIWKNIFSKDYMERIPGSRFDRLFMWLCTNRMIMTIIILVKSRLLTIKILRRE